MSKSRQQYTTVYSELYSNNIKAIYGTNYVAIKNEVKSVNCVNRQWNRYYYYCHIQIKYRVVEL